MALAPEVETTELVFDQEALDPARDAAVLRAVVKMLPPRRLSLPEDRPYGVCGYGAWALTALEPKGLLAGKRDPAHLLVADCAPPQRTALASGGQANRPVTAFA